MKRFTFGIVIILLLCIMGCDETESPSHWSPVPELNSIYLRFEQDTVSSSYNTSHSQEITARCLNNDGASLSDIEVEFSIVNPEDWKGQVSVPDTSVTDERGEIRATYSVNLQRSGTVSIEARSGLVHKTEKIELEIVE